MYETQMPKTIYRKIQAQIRITDRSNEIARATTFKDNIEQPIHNWFRFKEGFSPNLFSLAGIDTVELCCKDAVFIDPFCGSGTSILAGDLQENWNATLIGFEINPFIAFLAKTKTQWREFNPERFDHLSKSLLAREARRDIPTNEFPDLSSLRNIDLIAPQRVSALLDILKKIECIDYPEKKLLQLGIAVAVEQLGYYRKDGRALRINRREHYRDSIDKKITEVVLGNIWNSFSNDIRILQENHSLKDTYPNSFIVNNNGIHLELPSYLNVKNGSVNMIAYSPPYLNHIDYTEVYKIEAFLLGLIENSSTMRAQREKTLRSHGSYKFTASRDGLPTVILDAIDKITSEIAKSGSNWHKNFAVIACGYFQDMKSAFERQLELLKPDGRSICVVANSIHGRKEHSAVVATDLLLASLAISVGFECDELIVSRKIDRRGKAREFMRESIIVLKKQ